MSEGMASTAEDPAHALGIDLPQDLMLSSIDGSIFPSENDPHHEIESRATTPSASLRQSKDPDAAKQSPSPQTPEAYPTHTATENASNEVSDFDSQASSEGGSSESGSSVSNMSGAGYNSLFRLAQQFYMVEKGIMSRKRCRPEVSALVDHAKMMQWLSGVFRTTAAPEPLLTSGYTERVASIPQMRKLTWREYRMSVGAENSLCVVTEEPPPMAHLRFSPTATDERFLQKAAVLRPRANGIPTLPFRLLIYSLPVKRILSTLTDGRLFATAVRSSYIALGRPFKLLHCFEDQLRKRLSELKDLYNEPVNPSSAEAEVEQPNDIASGRLATPKEGMPMSRTAAERDELIFTSSYDWKTLTANERGEAYQDLCLLISFIDEYISPLRNAFRDADDTRLHFQELWYLFIPGSIVYIKDPGVPQKLWRVVQSTGGNAKRTGESDLTIGGMTGQNALLPFLLDCYYLDFDGTHFVRVIKTFQIDEFKDLSSVGALPIMPLDFAVKDGFIDRETIRKRGDDFVSYTSCTYSYYKGRSLIHEPEGVTLRRLEKGTIGSAVVLSEWIESPVVVDFERCLQEVPDWRPGRASRDLSRSSKDQSKPPLPPGFDDDRLWDVLLAERVLNYTDQSRPIELHGREPPSGDEVLLLPDRVFAFVLRTRKWACLPLGSGSTDFEEHNLTLMTEDHRAWDNLQIDDGHRTIIKSLMATHFRKRKSERRQFDIIKDKGKGLIILLHGVPGVGKTSTAETVAQYYNKPLLPITCGDLGLSPAEVEANLQSSFQMAQAWDCVLLLDEADVFLAERSQDNIERNALVSVFLRVMEYYEGILFLTTNKVGSFDEAFKSRMSMALYYPPLTQEQTRKIWMMQMDRTEELSRASAPGDVSQHVKFNRDEVTALSITLWSMQTTRNDCKPVWNGRQVRNAFQTAVALAEWHQKENHVSGPIIVRGEHFEKVAKVSNEFNAYLYEVKHERADYERAHVKEHRFDDFNRQQFVFGGQGSGQGQQVYGMPGVWQNPQQGNLMAYGGQIGNMMGQNAMRGVVYENNMQNQGAFQNNQTWQPGYGGVGNAGMGNMNLAGPAMGSGGGGNNMGTGMSPGSVNLQVLPGQSIQGQINNPQQQQQQQQPQPGSNVGPGGSMQPGFR